MDISEQIISANKKLKHLEALTANTNLVSKKEIYDTCLSLEVTVQTMIARTVNYKDDE